MDGLKLACKYSCVCQSAIHRKFARQLRVFATKKNESETKKEKNEIKIFLKHLDSYQFYLKIADLNKIKDCFDWRVVSYYWRGSPKLKGKNLWHNLTTLAPILNLRRDFVDSKLIDDCFVHPVRVVGKSRSGIEVKYFPVLKKKNNKLIISSSARKLKISKKNILLAEKISIADCLAVHSSAAIEKILPEWAKALSKIIHSSLDYFNNPDAR